MLQRGGAGNGMLFPHAHSGRAAPARALASVGPCGSPCHSGSRHLVFLDSLNALSCDMHVRMQLPLR
jgi:hypothetical protein